MKLISCLLVFFPFLVFAQKGMIKGKVIDSKTNQEIIGAYVYITDAYRTKSEIDGSYQIENLPYGKYLARVTMFSYDTTYLEFNINKSLVTRDIFLGDAQEFDEVEVIAQLAQDRKTPVAVSTISPKQLNEELGSQDLPMILNTTPGVHATQTGGGDGDARISIRGFSQRNVGVLIDGVPVNDMENGAVYWSNWFGLDQITQQIQVQRGLGATKLALPSVGGTMNILTAGTAGNRSLKFRQEYGTGNFLRSSISYNSGKLKNGWGAVFSGSYKQGDGWVDGLFTQGAFYYLKVQKRTGKHLTSFSVFGAPQKHGQRSYSQNVEYWDTQFARDLGINASDTAGNNRGIRFNEHHGTAENGVEADYGNVKSERMNFYHKPQITLKDFWKINKNFAWSNIAYVSIGRGGGQRARNASALIRDDQGYIDWDSIYTANQQISLFGTTVSTADPAYDPVLLKSSQILTNSINNHFWIGGLSQFDWKINDFWTAAGGIDYRYYEGAHWVEVADLLGGDYFVNTQNQNSASPMNRVGDKIGWNPWHNDRLAKVQWLGSFAQIEYEKGRWTAFANASGAVNSYQGIDYFQKRQLEIGDTLLLIGANDTVNYNGQTYTSNSEGLTYNTTEVKRIPGGTLKAGANFNFTENSNVFMNAGYLSRTPLFNNVINTDNNRFFENTVNEVIIAFEAGYGYRSKKLSFNVNAYHTQWKNKPFPFGLSIPDPNDPQEFLRVNIDGMDALHMGIEFDGAYRISKQLTLEGMVSLGDWTWQSEETVEVLGTTVSFDARGVHVGDAAQTTGALSLKYNFLKSGYIKAQYIYFANYYADFDPFSLQGENAGRESWQMPNYGLLNVFAGYNFKFGKHQLALRTGINNALNTMYISDARNNRDDTSDFDANSAQVFFGQGFRFNFSLTYEF